MRRCGTILVRGVAPPLTHVEAAVMVAEEIAKGLKQIKRKDWDGHDLKKLEGSTRNMDKYFDG
jgi:hypothetical protein